MNRVMAPATRAMATRVAGNKEGNEGNGNGNGDGNNLSNGNGNEAGG